ncbi:hypothetical protein HDF16_004056 [Granulicella aggregans]|uniref:Uncharacterized protein n=1 Tax=Granulicella aggregans TaxID=474949 RepID=A0A7W7ZGA5_9BACT|nr:hypothetical protein [Granulicella aggregans]
MIAVYGVCCKVCDEFISLGQTEKSKCLSTYRLTPVDPILCPHCGTFYVYEEWELIDVRRTPLSDILSSGFDSVFSQTRS